MIEVPDHLYTQQSDITQLETLAAQLPDEALVRVQLTDGGVITGTVSMRPIVQLFRDEKGNAGFNAAVRIEDQAQPGNTHYLWLDHIASVTRLGSA